MMNVVTCKSQQICDNLEKQEEGAIVVKDDRSYLYEHCGKLCADLCNLNLTKFPEQMLDFQRLFCLTLSYNKINEVCHCAVSMALHTI